MKKSEKETAAKKKVTRRRKAPDAEPLMSATASATYPERARRHPGSNVERANKFGNIDDGLIPFKYGQGNYNYGRSSSIDVRDAVTLCQKAYYNFAVFRNTVDLMTEFSVNNIYLEGGTKKSRTFFESLFSRINLWALQDKFFREYYRSGNVFVYRFDAKFKTQDVRKISQSLGLTSNAAKNSSIPSRYMILNPADIKLTGGLSFAEGYYSKLLNPYEIHRLKNPESEEEKEFLKTMDPETKKRLNKKGSNHIMMPLDRSKISAVFYKKQDYEPFAVPMGYPVLEDLNAKSELKKMDLAISRTMQQSILLVTMGAEPDKGGVNQKNLEAMQELFNNESLGRVLIADYTTKADFVLPNVGTLLNPDKYTVLERDIRTGLNNVLVGENEKFANQSIKVKIFIERLKQARETFINEFLMPEVKRISKDLGLKNHPTPHFDDIDLRDDLQFARVYGRMVEIGILTPEEGIKAMETGRLPTEDESLESQEEYRTQRDRGLYEPMLGGPETQKGMQKESIKSTEKVSHEGLKSAEKINKQKIDSAPPPNAGAPQQKKNSPKENGRPPGSGTPQKSKNVSPMNKPAQVGAEDLFCLSKVKDNLILAQKLTTEVEKELRTKHKIRKLSRKQKEIAENISELIIANEKPEDWMETISVYLEKPCDKNDKRVEEVKSVAWDHQVDMYLASILTASKKS